MYKSVTLVLIVITIATLGMLACGSKAEIKPAEVVSADIYTVSGNATHVVIQSDFKVKNPNDMQVTLDSFEYVLSVEDKDVGYVQFSADRGVSASEQISLSGTVVVSFNNLVADAMFSHGLSQGNALSTVLPYWKKMGGANPAAPMQATWDSIDPSVTLTASGSAYIEAEGQRVTTDFMKSVTK